MPTYTLKNTVTEEVWDTICSYDELMKKLEEDNISQIMKFPASISQNGTTYGKTSDGWKDLTRNMHKHAGRGSTIKT